MHIKTIEIINNHEIRKIVSAKGQTLYYQAVPENYDGKDISKVFNSDTLQDVRLHAGFDYIGDAMTKTIGTKPMREYDQNKKGYRADNRK